MELEQNTIEFIGKPKICCIDIGGEDIELIRKRGANVATGTLGAKIEIPEFLSDTERSVLPNHKLPDNLHEFDIIIIDLNKFETIVYNGNDHIKKQHTGRTSVSFLTGYPETLFDPRPFGSLCLAGMIKNVTNRDFLVLVFGCESYEVEYEINVVTNEPYRNDNTINKTGIYSFWHKVPIKETIFGTEISVTGATELHALLQKHVKDAEYHQTFNHPIDWHQGGNAIPSEKYTPLLINLNGDIVSYFQKDGHRNLILLPQLKSQSAFIIEFLEKVGPSLYPQLFPFSTSFNWKEQPDYWLPRHTDLIKQRELIVQDFEKKISDNEKSIENNSRKYSFLHHIIYQTGGAADNRIDRVL